MTVTRSDATDMTNDAASRTAEESPAPSSLLSVRDLRVGFGRGSDVVEAVHGVSLDIARGQVVGLVGESGSGKSVTARAIMNLLRPPGHVTGGTIRFDGQDLLDLSDAQWRAMRGHRIAMIFQDPLSALNPSMRIGDQVAEALEAHGVGRAAARTHAVDLLDRVGIPRARERFSAYPHEFSGGMRQRVVIAAALANQPDLLIADEPTTALDVTVQAQILELLRDLREEFDLATLFITHDLGVVAEFCDEVTVLRDGRVVEEANVSQLFTAPEAEYTQQLLAAVPRIDASPARAADRSMDHDEPVAVISGDTPVLSVRSLRVDVSGGRRAFRTPDPIFAVDDVSFHLRAGETLGLVGESGCGKSTLSRAIAGLVRVSDGTVEVDGHDVTALPVGHPRRRGVQYVFQDAYAALNPLRTIRQSLEEARASAQETDGPDPAELMRLVGLQAEMLDRRPAEFSGGQRQRVGIARSLAARPRVLLCDEPVSALDVSVQAQVIQLLERLRDELGIGILFIAHDLAVVKHLSDRVAVMRAGRIVESGLVDEVYEHPQHPYTKQLLSASPLPEVGAARDRILAARRNWGIE